MIFFMKKKYGMMGKWNGNLKNRMCIEYVFDNALNYVFYFQVYDKKQKYK
jgi:hypothetical protein